MQKHAYNINEEEDYSQPGSPAEELVFSPLRSGTARGIAGCHARLRRSIQIVGIWEPNIVCYPARRRPGLSEQVPFAPGSTPRITGRFKFQETNKNSEISALCRRHEPFNLTTSRHITEADQFVPKDLLPVPTNSQLFCLHRLSVQCLCES